MIALLNNSSQSYGYGVSLAIWDHTVLPATRHKCTHSALTPARGWYSIYLPGGIEGWVAPGNRLHTEMVYPPTHSRSTGRKSDALTTTLPSHQSRTRVACWIIHSLKDHGHGPWVFWVHDVPDDFQAIKLCCSLTCLLWLQASTDINFIVSHRKKNEIVHNS